MDKILLQNTAHGLVPMYDDDYDEKKKLKLGVVYEAYIKTSRNYQFLKKYFALINCSWQYLNEKIQDKVYHGNREEFRKSLEITAGFYETIYSLSRKEFIQIPRSIAFDKMQEDEFRELYERVKDVLFQVFLKDINRDTFEKELQSF
jgi:hypothetical protein